MQTTPSTPGTLDRLVDATPAGRDRYIDLLRAVSIAVVVVWHWVFSITHWTDSGRLAMPNPIDDLRGGWAATWLLQVIPVFFIVGGYANFASLRSARRSGTSALGFVRSRMDRLMRPVAGLLGVWFAFEVTARTVAPGYPGVTHWGMVVFVPLWFIGVYAGVVALVPLTARLHERAPVATLVGLAAAIVVVDTARFHLEADRLGYVNGALVFVFAHQLGYFSSDGTLTAWSQRRLAGLTATALAGLALLTGPGPYPTSMVATPGARLSNLNPPTAAIACLAVFQLGVVLLLRPAANRWLARRGPWKAVIAVNSVLMTVFLWHMTAYVLALGVIQSVGHRPGAAATGDWWLQRPLWLVLPGVMLVPLVAMFKGWERPRRSAPEHRPSLPQAQEVDGRVDRRDPQHLETDVDVGGGAGHDRP